MQRYTNTFIPKGHIPFEWGTSVEHLNASWMVLDGFGRNIENRESVFGNSIY